MRDVSFAFLHWLVAISLGSRTREGVTTWAVSVSVARRRVMG